MERLPTQSIQRVRDAIYLFLFVFVPCDADLYCSSGTNGSTTYAVDSESTSCGFLFLSDC
jgi:hypothetical protein